MPLEHATQNEGAQDVLAPADDGEEPVELGTAREPAQGVVPAGEDVEGQRQTQVDRRLVEGGVHGIVIVRHRRIAGQHDAAQPERLDAP